MIATRITLKKLGVHLIVLTQLFLIKLRLQYHLCFVSLGLSGYLLFESFDYFCFGYFLLLALY